MQLYSLAEPLSCFLIFSCVIFFIFVFVVVYSPRKCTGVEGKVYGRFLPTKEHDPYRLCGACKGKSCHPDVRCDD